MLLPGVLDEAYDQHQASAGNHSGKSLHDEIIRAGDVVQAAVRRHHGVGKPLQEIAAQTTPDRADKGVTDKSKTMLLGCRRRKMRADNAGNDLNNKVARRPN